MKILEFGRIFKKYSNVPE